MIGLFNVDYLFDYVVSYYEQNIVCVIIVFVDSMCKTVVGMTTTATMKIILILELLVSNIVVDVVVVLFIKN
jgi:hypothetical protein